MERSVVKRQGGRESRQAPGSRNSVALGGKEQGSPGDPRRPSLHANASKVYYVHYLSTATLKEEQIEGWPDIVINGPGVGEHPFPLNKSQEFLIAHRHVTSLQCERLSFHASLY
jgi:hypothetical protein